MNRAAPQTDDKRRVALVDLLDRVLAGGVIISGDIRLAIADVDLVQLSLRALISSISTLSTSLEPATHDALEPPGDD
ncbi:gas vesicle protein [Nocardia sp. NPDC057455]|uniref:gas vesicle protein n=1 Tax=Nocardia sp. NPDC057455 TaxID=3346138 RepID=UPI00366DAB94